MYRSFSIQKTSIKFLVSYSADQFTAGKKERFVYTMTLRTIETGEKLIGLHVKNFMTKLLEECKEQCS